MYILYVMYFFLDLFTYFLFSIAHLLIFEISLHILIKIYVLTLTAYKFLDIVVDLRRPTSHVEIAINDNWGNRIILPHAMWKASIERQCRYWAINAVNYSIIIIDSRPECTIELVKVCDTKNVKLSLHDTCLYMKSTTIFFLFKLEQCVEHAYYKLNQCTHGVSEKFKFQ